MMSRDLWDPTGQLSSGRINCVLRRWDGYFCPRHQYHQDSLSLFSLIRSFSPLVSALAFLGDHVDGGP